MLRLLAVLLLLPAAALADLVVTGRVLYGAAEGARRAAVADIVTVYAHNPVYMRMRALGLSETDRAARPLFDEAQATTNKALARSAQAAEVDVITVPGGVTGGEAEIQDLTLQVVELLPVYYVDGKVLSGRTQDARRIAELSSPALLAAIPAYRDWTALKPDHAQYHFLLESYTEAFEKAVQAAARAGGFDAVVEKGGVTSRLGPVPDVTAAAIEALDG